MLVKPKIFQLVKFPTHQIQPPVSFEHSLCTPFLPDLQAQMMAFRFLVKN